MTTVAHYRDLDIVAYHADTTHDSHSSLQLFRESRARYYHQRISGRLQPKPPTKEQRLGNATHSMVLQPELLDQLLVVIPADVLAKDGSRRGKAWDAWIAEQGDLIPVDQEEMDGIRWQVEAIHQHPVASELLRASTVFEHSLFWTSGDGDRLKVRLDAADELDARIVDLKTSRRPEEFHRDVREYAYHRQAALYLEGYRAMYGTDAEFLYVVVGNKPPYDCLVYRLPADALTLGAQENRQTLSELRECRAGSKPWLPEGHGRIVDLALDAWFYPKSMTQPIAGDRHEY